jgi:hypothetical protein
VKRVFVLSMLVALTAGAAAVQAGQGGNCSPEGTWYGYNTGGDVWIVTITRSGPKSYTTVMDYGPNNVFVPPEVIGYSDWRGELVKTGPKQYDWTTMALWRGDETAMPPFAMGYCPWTAEFTGCDSWQGEGFCDFYGFLTPEADPFEDGFPIFQGEPAQAFFKRMPMTYPTP